ncbi:MAG: hypothetical protein M1837_003573 [Sclerophora amabilis]|nr:MAG: hypothetical protein M1837_003573 [Sclerophora amabilis]
MLSSFITISQTSIGSANFVDLPLPQIPFTYRLTRISYAPGEADQHLLLSILQTHTIKLDHDAIAKQLGPQCTPRAVVERLKTLRRMARERAEKSDEKPGAVGAASSNGNSASKTNGTPSPKKRKGGEAGGTPTKKRAGPRSDAKAAKETGRGTGGDDHHGGAGPDDFDTYGSANAAGLKSTSIQYEDGVSHGFYPDHEEEGEGEDDSSEDAGV